MGEEFYWLIEYGKVLLGYGLLMFAWPLIVFRKYLAGKSITFRFSFCVTSQVVIINTVVLGLGLLHILNQWTMRLVFGGIFLYSIRDRLALTQERKNKWKHLLHGSFGIKNFLLLERRKYIRILEEFVKKVWGIYKRHLFEYSVLLIVIGYGLVYFSWGAFQNVCLGTSDLLVHHSWIYELSQGNIFSAGVYPEGMHCFIYALNALFGISVYNSILFLQIIHLGTTFLAMYCLLKELFQWRLSAVFVLLLFLLLDVKNMDSIMIMSRLQWTLPQEFGFPTIFLCALYLLRYLKSDTVQYFKKKTKSCWNDELLIFVLALAGSIIIHFYVTIMAFFVCIPIAVFMLKSIFTKKRFGPLVAGVVLGVVISMTPMLAALASGMQFQGSINWAISIFTSDNSGYTGELIVQPSGDSSYDDKATSGSEASGTGAGEGHIEEAEQDTYTFLEKISAGVKGILDKLSQTAKKIAVSVRMKLEILSGRYRTLFGETRAKWQKTYVCMLLAVYALYNIRRLYKKKKGSNEKEVGHYTREYPTILFIAITYMIMYSASALGLPALIEATRLSVLATFFAIAVFTLPVDMLYGYVQERVDKSWWNVASIAIMLAMVVIVIKTGSYHGYLFYYYTRYNAAVNATNTIMDNLPKQKYTIVSPTEELYHVIGEGWHEELTDFLKPKEKRYVIPTQYVFIFQEKKVLRYVQHHFFAGPEWLAVEGKYYIPPHSVGNDVICADISDEEASKEIIQFFKLSDAYKVFESRIILESRLHAWCEKFKKAYPNELKTLYEDDYFACYYFEQNMQSLYDLNLK